MTVYSKTLTTFSSRHSSKRSVARSWSPTSMFGRMNLILILLAIAGLAANIIFTNYLSGKSYELTSLNKSYNSLSVSVAKGEAEDSTSGMDTLVDKALGIGLSESQNPIVLFEDSGVAYEDVR